MRLLVIGHGRMGQLVERLAPEYDFEVVGVLTGAGNRAGAAISDELCREADVAVEFTRAEATAANARALVRAGLPFVIGTTGWNDETGELRRAVESGGAGVVAAANFSVGANVMAALVEHAGRLLADNPDYGAWLHEWHHRAKRDAPSGTALMMREAFARASAAPVDVSSTRAGSIPGTHTFGFDGPAESITIEHLVRDRATFARGALVAARWVVGRRGWFTMRDVLGL